MSTKSIYELDDPIVCMGAIDSLNKYGFEFKVEHVDGIRMTASEQFIRTAFYVRNHQLRNDDLEIYYSFLALYTKESRWIDLSERIEEETQQSITDVLFIKNGKSFTFDPQFYPNLESYADFIARVASSKSCKISWSKQNAIVKGNIVQ